MCQLSTSSLPQGKVTNSSTYKLCKWQIVSIFNIFELQVGVKKCAQAGNDLWLEIASGCPLKGERKSICKRTGYCDPRVKLGRLLYYCDLIEVNI
jgi:hypothetical protein